MHVMIGLQLFDAEDNERDIFYDALSHVNWEKSELVQTQWRFEAYKEEDIVLKFIHNSLTLAADDSKIVKFNACIQIGSCKPMGFSYILKSNKWHYDKAW